MNKLNIKVVALAVSLAFSAGTMSQGVSKNDYNASKDKVAVKHKSGCASPRCPTTRTVTA